MTAVGSALGEILPLLLIFIVIPMIELVLLIKVGSTIGILPTLGLILLTAFIGVNLLRRQGMATLMRARQNMEQGKLPAQELAEGFLLALAGALLLTPGFVTDAIGFTLLVPSMRKRLTGSVLKLVVTRQMGATGSFQSSNPFQQPKDIHSSGNEQTDQARHEPSQGANQGTNQSTSRAKSNERPNVIEGEYRRED